MSLIGDGNVFKGNINIGNKITFNKNEGDKVNKYVNNGQVGVFGENNQVSGNTFNQNNQAINIENSFTAKDADELGKLINSLSENKELKEALGDTKNLELILNLSKVKDSIKSGDLETQKQEISKFRKFLLTDLGELTEKVVNGIRTASAAFTLSKALLVNLGIELLK